MTVPLRGPAVRLRPAVHLQRAFFAHTAHAASENRGGSPEALCRAHWGDDAVTPLILRSPSTQASRTDPNWAGILAHSAVGDFIASLAPLSAAAQLFEAAPKVSLDGVSDISFPTRSGPIDPSRVQWVSELDPSPTIQLSLTAGVKLGPARKLVAIVVITSELARSSNAETAITQLLRENAAIALDATLFSNLPATSARPAGALYGITPLAAGSGMDQDLVALARVVGRAALGLVYIGHPDQINAIRLLRGQTFPDIPLWPTLGVAPGTIIALDPAGFVSAFGSVPEISSSREMVIQELDNPDGSPTTGPTRSLFQTDSVATRLKLRAAWCWRAPNAVAYVTGTTW